MAVAMSQEMAPSASAQGTMQAGVLSEAFGARLRRWRSALGLSQAELGRRASYSRQYVWDIEHKYGGGPCAEVRRRLLDVLLAAHNAHVAEMADAAQIDATVNAWRRTDATGTGHRARRKKARHATPM